MSGQSISKAHHSPILDPDGRNASSDAILDRWHEYYTITPNHTPAAACPDIASTSALPDDNISSDCPTVEQMEGISKAIQRLNNGKVAGSDGIHPEFLTCAVLQSNQCSSYRPISLLSVPGKVFVNVLLSRLEQLLTSHRRPNQSSFSTGRSKVDVILAVRLLAEIHRAPLPAFECRLHRHEVGL